MGPDVVEIALESMTDAAAFEKLAAEVMRDFGYPRIVPLGGVHDVGRDAVQDALFQSEDRVQTVFQFTLSAEITRKALSTVEKLAEHSVKYDELVLVTKASVSTERHDRLIARCRKEHAVFLRVYDRKVLVNRLADFGNGIFYRFFPDIEKQVRGILDRRSQRLHKDERSARAQLIACKAFVLHKGAGRARRGLLDHMVTGLLLAGSADGLSLVALRAQCDAQLGEGAISEGQLAASLERLRKAGVALHKQERYLLSDESLTTLVGAECAADVEETSVVQDLVDCVSDVAGSSMTRAQRDQLQRNAHALLAEFFRVFGVELSEQFLRRGEPRAIYHEAVPGLIRIACQGVPRELGDALVAAVAEALARPTDSQAGFFARYARAYLALAVLNLDPSLRALQLTRLRGKTFILDTDFVLECIIGDAPRGRVYPRIVWSLQEAGCRTVVPETVLSEVAEHAEIAPRTYKWVTHSLLHMPEAVVLERVGNAFVRGYYYAKSGPDSDRTLGFAQYLRNYYEAGDPAGYLGQVVKNALPGVEILNVDSLLTEAPSEEERQRFSDTFLDIETGKPKAAYRSAEEMRALADADAKLLQTVIELNKTIAERGDSVLGRDVFLVTNSGRYLSCLRALGVRQRVCSRPQVLMGLLELIGRDSLSEREFVSLFENPLLQYAVNRMWNRVRVLLDAGLELRGCSLPRLSWDLDTGMNEKITDLSAAEARAEADDDEAAEKQANGRYLELLDEATARGYSAAPVVDELLSRVRRTQEEKVALEEELQKSSETLAELQEKITFFGKKKQRYFRRMQRARGQQGGV